MFHRDDAFALHANSYAHRYNCFNKLDEAIGELGPMRAKTKRLLEGAAATDEAEAIDIQQLVELEVVDSQYHFTPLTWACCAGNTKVVARILRELKDKDVYCTRQSCWRVAGECVCHHHGSHGGAQRFRQGDPKGVFHRSKHEARADLEDGSCLKRMDDVLPCSVAGDGGSKGWTALHMAASKGRLEIVQLLINAGADVDAARDDGAAAMSRARQSGHDGVVRALSEAGERPRKVPRR